MALARPTKNMVADAESILEQLASEAVAIDDVAGFGRGDHAVGRELRILRDLDGGSRNPIGRRFAASRVTEDSCVSGSSLRSFASLVPLRPHSRNLPIS